MTTKGGGLGFQAEQSVLDLFNPLRQRLGLYVSEVDIEHIYHAFLFAAQQHDGQFRCSGDPYISHPVSVALLLAEWRMDVESIKAALLHDVIEDTDIDKLTLAAHFGDVVAELVDGVSKLTQISFSSRLEAQAENFRKMLLAVAQDLRVILVKLADRLHNMSTIDSLSTERRRRIARETLDIFAPIANRIGMHGVALELEDLGFRALYPDRYRILKASVERVQGQHSDILSEIKLRFQQRLKEVNIAVVAITSRAKHAYSIYCKMRDNGLSFSELTDVYAIRIVTENLDACYRTLGVVHGVFKPVPGRFKDYIALPKANGYQSIHTVLFGPFGVPIEVQIRTRQMDESADHGVAAHWQYKVASGASNLKSQQTQRWVQRLMEIQQRTGNSLEFLENVKVDLFPDEIYVFSPKGDIYAMPAGATALDFAYAVHTDVGNACVAIKVDRQMAPLASVLSSGHTVEVITSEHATPNSAWLNFVRTAKARSSIRHYLKQQQQDQSEALGQKLLEAALLEVGVDLDHLTRIADAAFLKSCGVETFSELLEDIGMGRRAAKIVARQLLHLDESPIKVDPLANLPLMIQGTEGVVVQFATCCHPVPGDPIVGWLCSEEGMDIHHARCASLTQKNRLKNVQQLPVCWDDAVEGDFSVEISIDTQNQRGVLAMLALAVSDVESSICDIQIIRSDTKYAQVNIEINVVNRTHLAQVMRRLRRIPQVIRVRRGGRLMGVKHDDS